LVEKFENVSVSATINLYFEGKVQSRSVWFADGLRKSLGVILPGTYEFGVGDREEMEVVVGSCEVILPGETEWKRFEAGEIFHLPANSRYSLRCDEVLQYLCGFFKE
jgi:uncharacterized protein YaiE (UPF0345 family)